MNEAIEQTELVPPSKEKYILYKTRCSFSDCPTSTSNLIKTPTTISISVLRLILNFNIFKCVISFAEFRFGIYD